MLLKNAMRTFRLSIPLLLAALILTPVLAQDGGRVLEPGVPIDGALNVDQLAQVYFFTAQDGDTVTLIAESETLALNMVLTDSAGDPVAQASDFDATGSVELPDITLVDAGTYYVTVFVAAGVGDEVTGVFTITLEGDDEPAPEPTEAAEPTDAPEGDITETPEPGGAIEPEDFSISQVITNTGIVVNLNWDTPDDLNLQVRDPVGETLFWDSRTTSSGGTFDFDVNGLCEVISTNNNVETARWPAGPVSTGSYEVLVYYRQPCEGTNPVDFTVDITVDGESLEPISGTLQPPAPDNFNVHISSFVIDEEGNAVNGPSGPYTDTNVLPIAASEILAEPAEDILFDQPVTGVITTEQYYQTFRFAGNAGEIVSIAMEATQGNLDTLLLVLDSGGNIVGSNDDLVEAVNTNSGLNALRLPTTDTYTIMATRYGKDVGGTEGTYQLVVSNSTLTDVPQEVIDLQLPQGDIEITLTWNTNADLRLLVRDPFLDSVYNDNQAIQSGGRLNATGNLNCNISTTTPVSYVYWPDGAIRIGTYEVDIWNRSTCDDTRSTQFNLYIVIEDQLVLSETRTIEFDEHFITSFTINNVQGDTTAGELGQLGGSETLSIQEEVASAVSISSGQTLSGSLSADNFFDLYVFDGEPDDVVTIGMTATGNLDTFVMLIDPSGFQIAQNDDANESTNSLISQVTLSQAGQYVIVASRFGTRYGGTTGAYNLTLRIDRP